MTYLLCSTKLRLRTLKLIVALFSKKRIVYPSKPDHRFIRLQYFWHRSVWNVLVLTHHDHVAVLVIG